MNEIEREFIRSLRRARGMTQKDVATLLGYESASGYNALENGQVKMTVEQLKQLKRIFNITNEAINMFFLNE